MFADDMSSPAKNFAGLPSTHFLRNYRPKTYGDYALDIINRSGRGQHRPSDDDQPRIDDRTAQDCQNDPLAIAIDGFITASICLNGLPPVWTALLG